MSEKTAPQPPEPIAPITLARAEAFDHASYIKELEFRKQAQYHAAIDAINKIIERNLPEIKTPIGFFTQELGPQFQAPVDWEAVSQAYAQTGFEVTFLRVNHILTIKLLK